MNFFETRMGHKFFDNDVPRMIKAVERVADAMEKANAREERESEDGANAPIHDALMERILRFAKEEDFGEGDVGLCQMACRTQLRSLWTTYCICKDYEVDTAPYDRDIAKVWDAVIENRTVVGSRDIFDDFECFDDFMCEELV